MLNIPDEVKALFSSDTVKKNFHVHFPDGETSDLNNEDIVSESVSFIESLCSQQYFKFGLAEASQIEFTAVGIPNVRGAYIEAAIEIDCTRLGDAWAAEHLPDLTLPFLTAQTCFYGDKLYYRVPYGRFKIDTCPRNHGAMYQRQITAYSEGITEVEQTDDFIVWKDNLLTAERGYKPDFLCNVLTYVHRHDVSGLADRGFSKTEITNLVNFDRSAPSVQCKNSGGSSFTLSLDVQRTGMNVLIDIASVWNEQNNLYSIENNADMIADFIANAVNMLDENGIDAAMSGYSSLAEIVNALLDGEVAKGASCFQIGEIGVNGYQYFPLPQETELIYPYRPLSMKYTGAAALLAYPIKYTLTLSSGQATVDTSVLSRTGSNPKIYRWVPYDLDLPEITLTPATTLKQKVNGVAAYSYANSYSMKDAIIGYLELIGDFIKPDRDGNLSFFQMSDNPTAIAVSASDWSSFWWDETPIDSIGLVNVIYTQDGEEQQQSFNIGDGNSVYTIENNEVLKSAELDETTMQSILTTYFEPNASVVNFTPVELEMRGLPYLESGDYIELTAEDGETVETYILSQTISGIQHLTAEVTSTNGALLEVIVNE